MQPPRHHEWQQDQVKYKKEGVAKVFSFEYFILNGNLSALMTLNPYQTW